MSKATKINHWAGFEIEAIIDEAAQLAAQAALIEEKLKQARAARNARAARGRGPADKEMSDAAAVAAENNQIRALENALKNLGF